MKGLIFKLITFITIILLFDYLIGKSCEKLYETSQYSSFAKLRYTLFETKEDLLILGSSRAMNQLNPKILEKNTGLSTYNCGFGGQGLIFSYIQLIETLKRYKPKAIILDVSPNILIDNLSNDKLKILMPYYKRDTIIFNALISNDLDRIKFLSAIYPYNSTIGSLLRGLYDKYVDSLNGFVPVYNILDTNMVSENLSIQFKENKIPHDKFIDLYKIIDLCEINNIKTIIIIGPFYKTNKNLDKILDQIYQELKSYKNISFLDFSRNSLFLGNGLYFYDNLHLNKMGADLYSDLLSHKIELYLNN